MLSAVLRVERYVLFDAIASGGMASVHLGRMLGPVGFSRTVAVKRLHSHLAQDPEFVAMFLDEARLAARIQHPNVVSTLDIVASGGELFVVMDYVQGDSLSQLTRATSGSPPTPRVVTAIMTGVLYGLHAAHEAKSESGGPLEIVHRDVSPQNVLVGVDGVARVVDFGVAKAVSRVHSTRDGQIKGKLGYMAPEQIRREHVDRRADVYAAAVVLWETLTGQRLFRADDAGAVIAAVLESVVPPASTIVAGLSLELDAAIARALAPSPDARFATALEFAAALEEAAGPPAPQREVAEWVNSAGGARLAARRDLLMAVEQTPTDGPSGEVSALNGQPRSRAEVRAASEAATMVVPAAESATAAGGELQAQPLRTIPASRPSSRQFGITAGIVLAGLALFGLVAARTRHRHPVAAERTAPPPSALVTAAAPASSGEAIESDASDAPTPPAASRPVSSHVAVHVAPHIAGSARKPTTPDNCDPAFTFDSAGVKHFKPRCL